MRLIDAEELFNKVGKIKPRNEEHYKAIGEFMNMITNSPTIESTTITTSTDEPVVINYPIIICDDAVSREDARMSLTCEIKENMTITDYISMVDKRLRKLPSVQPKHKTGHWIDVTMTDRYRCSECGNTADYRDNFCPNCGAKMVEPLERNDKE